METTIGKTRLVLVRGDITAQEVDAVVNAANSRLAGGGGVDGAIHRRGGPSIMEQCRRIGGCPTGSAVVTGAGDLPARWVIHAVGPVWSGGRRNEDALLASAWRASLDRAREIGARTVAFPSLSTGAYRFPVDRAARVALAAVREWLREHPDDLDEVRVVLFDRATFDAWAAALAGLPEAGGPGS